MAKSRPRYDIIIFPEDYGRKFTSKAIESLIQNLKFSGKIEPDGKTETYDWTEFYLKPGPTAHHLFTTGAFKGPHPVFYEAVLYHGDVKSPIEYGLTQAELYFYLEFRGVLFKEPRGLLYKLFKNILYIRPKVIHRIHESLPPRREVPEDQVLSPSSSTAKGGEIGTVVEEW